MHQLDLVPAVVQERCEPPPDAEIDLHPRVLGVLLVHVVALVVRDHLERQLVVVAQEEPPLRVVRNRRRAIEDLVDRRRVLAPNRHEHARHHREVERHVAFVAVAEILDDVLRPLVRLGEQHAVRIARVDLGAHPLEVLVRLRQVLAVRALALVQIRNRVETEAVDAEVEPEAQDVQHRLLHVRVVVVQVGLVAEEAVPVVLTAHRIERPVRRLRVEEDDACVGVGLVAVRPHVPVALRPLRFGARFLEPGVICGRVVHDEVGDHAHPTLMRLVHELAEVVDRPVVGMNREEVRDVVPAVLERRDVHREQPDAVDPEPLQEVELVDQPAEVARAVVVAVEEAADVDLVEDRPLEPDRVALEPLLAHAPPILKTWLLPGGSRT